MESVLCINVLLDLNINDEIFDAISQVDRTNALLGVFVSLHICTVY